MKIFRRSLLTLLPLITLCLSSNSQWQYCGNYTSYVVQFAVKDSVLIAGTYGNGVYITTDGENWTYSKNGMVDGQIISFATIGNLIFAGSETEGVFRSTDNGYNWTAVNNGISNNTIHWLSSDGNNLYAATSQGVNKTTDNGGNWLRISPSSIGTVMFSVVGYSNKIITSSVNGVFYSADSGLTWQNISSGVTSYVYCFSFHNDTVYAGSSSSGVFITANNGTNWTHLGAGLPNAKAARTISFVDDKIFAALYNSGGIYFLPNGSGNWIPSNQGLTQLSCFTVIKFKDYIYAGTVSGIFRRPASEFISLKRIDTRVPMDYKLFQNYPNPFNPSTTIKFCIPGVGQRHAFDMRLVIYDLLGKDVATLVKKELSPGNYEVVWDATNFPSGVYFYKLTAGDFAETKKMILIK